MKNTKNIIIATLSIVVILFSIYEISSIYSKSNLVSDKSVEARKELDIYSVGYKTDDNNGTKTEITKRVGDFYCKVEEYYDAKSGEVEVAQEICGLIDGPIVYQTSDTVNCTNVININTPKGLNPNIDSCFDVREAIFKEVYKKFKLSSDDKVNVNYLKSNYLNDTFELGVSINCKDNIMKDSKVDDKNIGCAGAEFAVQKKTGEWILVGHNDECKEEKYICDNIESLIKQK